MDASPPAATVSLKRTSSTAENTTTVPDPKRRPVSPPTFPTQVYIVRTDTTDLYQNDTSTIEDLYVSLADANNAVRRLANDYTSYGDFDYGTKKDGRFYWSSEDSGEGGGIEIGIEIRELKPAGAEPECELKTVREDKSGDESFDEDEGDADY